MIADEDPAKYVIEIAVTPRARGAKIVGSIQLWETSGSFGVGDKLMGLCPRYRCKGLFSLGGILPPEHAHLLDEDRENWPPDVRALYREWHSQIVVCGTCGFSCRAEDLADSYMFNTSPQGIADVASEYFDLLGGDADVYLVRTTGSTRLQQGSAMIRSMNVPESTIREALDAARQYERAILTRDRLLRDADLKSVSDSIKALIVA